MRGPSSPSSLLEEREGGTGTCLRGTTPGCPTLGHWAASGEHIGATLGSQSVVEPSVESRGIRARQDAGPLVVRENNSSAHEKAKNCVALGLELALALALHATPVPLLAL